MNIENHVYGNGGTPYDNKKEMDNCEIHGWLDDDGTCHKCERQKEIDDIRIFEKIIKMWHKSIALHDLAVELKFESSIKKYRDIRNYLSNKIDYYEPKN